MAEITNELVYEILKAVQADVAALRHGQKTIEADLRVMRGHMGAFLQGDVVQDSRIAEMEARIERIERRLDLVD